GRRRGQLPAVALQAHEDGRAHDRLQARHRGLQRGRLPARGPGPDLLPRAVRGADPDRPRQVTAEVWVEAASAWSGSGPLGPSVARLAGGLVAELAPAGEPRA